MNRSQRVILGAPFERDLELAWQRAGKRMPEEVPRHRFCVRGDIEHFVVRNASVRARSDISHRVATRLAGGHTHCAQIAHGQLGILE